jgi:hypothetical protein
MAGPQAQSVTYADNEGALHTVATNGNQGAYLIVLRAPRLGLEAGEYVPLGGAGGGTIRSISYRNGQTCRLERSEPRVSPYTQQTCPRVGERPRPGPLTATSVASPITVTPRRERVRIGRNGERALVPMLIVGFRAHAEVANGSSEYRIEVSCGVDRQVAPIFSDIRRGQLVHHAVPNNCQKRRTRVTVRYVYGGHSGGPPTDLLGTTLAVGSQTVAVP